MLQKVKDVAGHLNVSNVKDKTRHLSMRKIKDEAGHIVVGPMRPNPCRNQGGNLENGVLVKILCRSLWRKISEIRAAIVEIMVWVKRTCRPLGRKIPGIRAIIWKMWY